MKTHLHLHIPRCINLAALLIAGSAFAMEFHVSPSGQLVVHQHWSITRGLVMASDEKNLTTATPMGWIGHGVVTTASPGKFCYLEHARDFLDQPGEWFLDKASGVLHYLQREGEDPANIVNVRYPQSNPPHT